jgi:carbonic anhydrase
MAGRLKGLDQISAWVIGFFTAAGVISVVWYSSKYYVKKIEQQKSEEIAKTIKDLESINTPKSSEVHKPAALELAADKTPIIEAKKKPPLQNYGYSGNLAPWYWSSLNDKWKRCETTIGQSPIDLSGAKLDQSLKSLKLFYQHGVTSVSFQHQTVQGSIERGSYIEWDGERYDLSNVYVRTPSEHRVNSLPFEMEVQLEHESIDNKKIMISTLFTTGKSNQLLERLGKNIPTIPGDAREVGQLNWTEIFPKNKTYWTYIGSGSIPPCEPGVRWIIFTNEVTASKTLIDHLVLKQKSNVRPVFKLGARSLTRSNR